MSLFNKLMDFLSSADSQHKVTRRSFLKGSAAVTTAAVVAANTELPEAQAAPVELPKQEALPQYDDVKYEQRHLSGSGTVEFIDLETNESIGSLYLQSVNQSMHHEVITYKTLGSCAPDSKVARYATRTVDLGCLYDWNNPINGALLEGSKVKCIVRHGGMSETMEFNAYISSMSMAMCLGDYSTFDLTLEEVG